MSARLSLDPAYAVQPKEGILVIPWRTFPGIAVVTLLMLAQAGAGEPKWKKHTINGKSEFEAAGVLDVNNDGKLDIVCGDTWYQAPDWKPHHVRDVQRQGTYYNYFATLPMDVNGDGHTDYVTVSYFGRNVGWVENPGKPGASGPTMRSTSPARARRRGPST